MKILTLHCDYIKFKALKKAFKDAEELSDKAKEMHESKECLVILTAVEKGDTEATLSQVIEAIKKTASEVKAKNLVLYPYAHLSSNLSSPSIALEYLIEAEKILAKNYNVVRAPFGHYKEFELKVKGHPLSELSKEFKPSEIKKDTEDKVLVEKYEPEKLLKEISKTKLDTSKLKDNDHRILGQKLDLFSFNEVSPGQPFWHHHGYVIFTELVTYVRKLLRQFEYLEVSTPKISENKLWKVSGHWDHYKNNMFITKYEDRDFGVKPMNCPSGMLIYRTKPRSYKELPMRLAEFGEVHRQELSGVLSGLFRVIRITQDDGHIFCTKEQIGNEISSLLKMIKIIYKDTFGFDYHLELSTRPDKFLGDIKDWNHAEKMLEDALDKSKVKYKINKGDGAFYGPKIDIHIKDSLERSWQCATIQLDAQMPKRFGLAYIDEKGEQQTPLIIHRAILGSLERFIGVLLEHTNGNLPLWLSPRQVRVINFTDRNIEAAEKLVLQLKEEIPGIRVDTDFNSDTVQAKIRDAEMMKINYIVVIGDKEEKSKTIAVRPRSKKPEFGIKTDKFVKDLKDELIL